MERVHVKTDK